MYFLGIDVGSTTVKVVLTDEHDNLLDHVYRPAHGQPGQVLYQVLQEMEKDWDMRRVRASGLTGSGGGAWAPPLGGLHVNELIAQTHALEKVAPQARTVIEMGGQDSKLLLLEFDPAGGRLLLADFSMNALCAAGTGSFLDQQAERLGISIEELARLTLQAQNPARVAGRCTVFAKSDMIHLQQRGVTLPDIVAGLCLAVARNFRSIIGRGKTFRRPILFQGGVACNRGMVWAFEQVLGLAPGELIVPPHCTVMAALGAARVARSTAERLRPFPGLEPLAQRLRQRPERPAALPRLQPRAPAAAAAAVPPGASTVPIPCLLPICPALAGRQPGHGALQTYPPRPPRERGRADHSAIEMWVKDSPILPAVYVGVDVGSISTKVALLDPAGNLVTACYLYTAGRPLEAVREGLSRVAEQMGTGVRVLAAGVTGSGRYLVGDYVGADLVRNEITAQARAALALDPQVDTVLEIGGQDSKYIALAEGIIVDFTMNKACAAGTGSFLEEQAQRLHLEIEEFGPLALDSAAPAPLGERCTVFMESDLVHHQQQGAGREDLVAGLAYSIAQNYLNWVVRDHPIGQRILFQGGVASNPAVVAAFEQLLGRPVVVPPHHRVSGAIGAALLAREEHGDGPSRFHGFDLSRRTYQSTTLACQGCPNCCEVQKVSIAGEKPFFYGARCERYEEAGRAAATAAVPDLFAEREKLLLRCYEEQSHAPGRPRVGLPRVLFMHELLPFWSRFFRELGWEVLLSPPTTPAITARSAEEAQLGQLPQAGGGQGGLEAEVELLEGAQHGEAGLGDVGIHRAIGFGDDLFLHQAGEESGVAHLALGRFGGLLLEDGSHRVEAQALELQG